MQPLRYGLLVVRLRKEGQEYLAHSRGVCRHMGTDARDHANRVRAINFVDIDDLTFVVKH